MLKTALLVVVVLIILFGIYKIVIDDEKGVGYISFIFSVVTFLFSMSLSDETSETSKTVPESEPVADESNSTSEENTEPDEEILSTLDSSADLDDEEDHNNENDTEISSVATEISGNTFSGNIITDNQEDFYEYTPDVSGKYRFDFDSDNANSDYEFCIYTSDGELLADSYYSSEGKTIELTANETYDIVVKQDSGKANYTITIGIPNNLTTVEGTNLTGTITYTNQENKYSYTAPLSGQYRFDFSISDVQCDYIFYIFASNNEELVSAYCSSDGKTVELTEGETYTIVIEQYSGFFDYSISIGVPHAIQSIEENTFSGNIAYVDQLDRYTYTAPLDGIYRFDFMSDNVQCDYSFHIYASNNEELASTYFSSNGKTVELAGGETYRIEIEQNSGFEDYTINIGVPNNITKVEGDIISGEITYIDQENVYQYTAPVSGEYIFSFGTNAADTDYKFDIKSSINEDILSTYYSSQSKTVPLERGQVYTIIVKHSSGFLSYQITIGIQ